MKTEYVPSFEPESPLWKRAPFKHQTDIAKFHWSRRHSLDLSEVGVGKTAPMIAALSAMLKHGALRRALVICSNSIIDNWQTELTINSDLSSIALRGTKEKRVALLQQSKIADVYLINYEGVRVVFPQLMAANFDIIVCDEIHHIKGHKGSYRTPSQSFLVRELGKHARSRRGMTGTVLTNNIEDLWAIAQFIDPDIFKCNFWGYRQRFMFDENAGKSWLKFPRWVPLPGAVQELHRLLEPYAIRFKKREVLKFLPPVLFERRYVELEEEQRRAYNELKRYFVTELQGRSEPLAVLQILARLTKLLQITSGFAYHGEEPYRFKSNAKLAELKKILDEIGEQRVIIWTAFTEEVPIICEALNGKTAVITGATNAKDRQPIVNDFNAGNYQYLVSNAACAGEGLTILAPYAIYYSRNHRLDHRIQSLGRNDRPGAEQFENICVIDLIAGDTCDVRVVGSLEAKEDLLETINPRSFMEMLQ